MSPVVIDLRNTEDTRDVVHRAVQALAEGQLVVFPTETVYGLAASALNEAAVARLLEVKRRREGCPLTLAIKSGDDALDYVPRISPLAERLARRCWPGPLTMVVDDDHPDSVTQQLPASVRRVICALGTIGLRVPAHEMILSVLRLSAGPLALTSANRSGQPDSVTADEVVRSLGDDVAMVLDDGPSKFAQPSSVVQVIDNRFKILRDGVITASNLRRLASFIVVFVCTGNTCRSPMAKLLFGRHLADKLGCPIADLEEQGLMVMSAGIAAMSGGRASAEAIEVMAAEGLDLSTHESQPLTERLVRFADLILTMTNGHREAIVAQWPGAVGRTHLLCRSGADVADPIGGPPEIYRRCADQIDAELKTWVQTIKLEEVLSSEESGE